MNNKPLFSVVTICYNCGNLIRKTIESVLAQNNNDSLFSFEYIIQDGASGDNTLEIVSEYKQRFEENNIPLIVNSLKDGGIYDAMNKAVSNANGEYVIFMNADDCFYSKDVLYDVFTKLISFKNDSADNTNGSDNITDYSDILPDIIYGDCIVKELGMYFKFRKTFDQIKDRMPFSHQSCFAKRKLLLETPLNTEYKITADYDFILKSYLSKKTFFDSEIVISLVTADGLSSVHMLDTFIEVNKVCDALSVPRFNKSDYEKKLKEMKLKQFVLSYFPNFIKLAIRKKQIKSRGQITTVEIPYWAK